METTKENTKTSKKMMNPLLLLNVALLAVGNCGGPLIMRLYFLHGGSRVWLSAGLETAGWPIILVPLLFTYLSRRRRRQSPLSEPPKLILMDTQLFLAAAVIGLLTGADDFLYAYGVARLPISTSALIIASQLGFTALFAFILVKQKFTSYSINAVVLLTIGAGVLALHTSSDRPNGESKREYFLGFFMTLGASALYGFVLPLVELTYRKSKQTICYTLVMEIQLVMCAFATLFCAVGMIINNDFKAIPKEARAYELGETKYYVVLAFNAILWQFFFLGAIGVIFTGSSLLSGIIIAVLLPLTETLAVLFYSERFKEEKAVSLILSLWGSVSYFYGEFKHSKMKKMEKDEKVVTKMEFHTDVSP